MQNMFVYTIFFFSGAAALIYEVVWVRYLSLVFGGSHLAVTTVLAVFMGGLAIGGYLIGKRVREFRKLLRLYALLELGIAGSAVMFAILIRLYPLIYVPLAQFAETSPLYLSILRVTFSIIVLIVPTTLMGGTLPVLSGLVSKRPGSLGMHLSFLYGFNTLGAVTGAAVAGFVLLRHFSVGATMSVAVLINLLLGVICLLLRNREPEILDTEIPRDVGATPEESPISRASSGGVSQLSMKLVIWGIGVSGFCALAYEVLWTRVLSVAIGASTYGFTLILVAFLAGIAMGSTAYGIAVKMTTASARASEPGVSRTVAGFGLVQLIIGITALVVTANIRDLPAHAVLLENIFRGIIPGQFAARQFAGLALAFSHMFVPAFFMGVAFPMAGRIHSVYREAVGHSVGELLAFNTVGAILGSSISGFFLIYFLGIERSLQVITLINIAFGAMVLVSLRHSRSFVGAAAAVSIAVIAILVFNPHKWRMWDSRFLAMYQASSHRMFRDNKTTRDTLKYSKVLYYGEGAQSIVSSLRGKAGDQSFITNGRVEASNSPGDMQCQYTLGHLPMLLAKNPRKVFVLGTGSGMTLGATSVHPSVERIILAEIEPKVLGVARTFSKYNHSVLDNPKLRIVFNDGRNFLLTTREKFDVITADPVHPWFSGAGYLYTSEYFRLAAEHLNPGGVICQWLPIYELTNENLKSVVKSFMANFSYVMLWMTRYDAELVGSNSPIVIDEEVLSRRIAEPEVRSDLQKVGMGTTDDFLSYFVMGNRGARSYGRDGLVNTDENLYLEFSAPESMGNTSLDGSNFFEIVRYRESILPYLKAARDRNTRAAQTRRWQERDRIAPMVDRAHGLTLAGAQRSSRFRNLVAMINCESPDYAPWEFLLNEYKEEMSRDPRLIKQVTLSFTDGIGEKSDLKISAVLSRLSSEYAIIDFVDNSARYIFGSVDVFGRNREGYIDEVVDSTLASIRAGVENMQRTAADRGNSSLNAATMRPVLKKIVASRLTKQCSIE